MPCGIFLFFFLLGGISICWAESPSPFVPLAPIMRLEEIKPGMVGEARTVLYESRIVKFPVTILSVVPRKGIPKALILIKAKGPLIRQTGGIAAGMSGSPVYVNGKLIGAIGYGWDFSDHTLGLVTPIEEMAQIWNYRENLPSFSPAKEIKEEPAREESEDEMGLSAEGASQNLALRSVLQVDGLSRRASDQLARSLNAAVVMSGNETGGDSPVEYQAKLEPGSAVSVLLAWGDVSVGAIGTLTAVDKNGRFVAFAHSFLNRGEVAYPLAKASVHQVVPSLEAPFKLGTPGPIIGMVTEDRPQGIGGRIGRFPPAVNISLEFTDADAKTTQLKRFQVVQDPFLISQIVPSALVGMMDDLWGRVGQGTAKTSMQIEGGGFLKGWTRTNFFFSDKDIGTDSLKECTDLLNLLVLNQFQEIRPLGIHFKVEMTQEPRILYIEGVRVDDKKTYAPGDIVSVDVTLRPYRKPSFTKTFTLKIPDKASGMAEILVRGGGIAEPGQESLVEGWKAITSFPALLKELSAQEANNEVILELNAASAFPAIPVAGGTPTAGVSGAKGKNVSQTAAVNAPVASDLMNPKLKSEEKEQKMREGTLRVFSTNYYVEGLLRKVINLKLDVTPVAALENLPVTVNE